MNTIRTPTKKKQKLARRRTRGRRTATVENRMRCLKGRCSITSGNLLQLEADTFLPTASYACNFPLHRLQGAGREVACSLAGVGWNDRHRSRSVANMCTSLFIVSLSLYSRNRSSSSSNSPLFPAVAKLMRLPGAAIKCMPLPVDDDRLRIQVDVLCTPKARHVTTVMKSDRRIN